MKEQPAIEEHYINDNACKKNDKNCTGVCVCAGGGGLGLGQCP